MKNTVLIALLGVILIWSTSCSNEPKLNDQTLTKYENAAQSVLDTAHFVNDIINANLQGLMYAFKGGASDGGITGLDPNFAPPDPFAGMPEEKLITIKEGIGRIYEKLNPMKGEVENIIAQINVIKIDITKVRAAITNDQIDEDTKKLFAEIPVNIEKYKSELAALDKRVIDIQKVNLDYLKSEEVLQMSYSWLLANTPRN